MYYSVPKKNPMYIIASSECMYMFLLHKQAVSCILFSIPLICMHIYTCFIRKLCKENAYFLNSTSISSFYMNTKLELIHKKNYLIKFVVHFLGLVLSFHKKLLK